MWTKEQQAAHRKIWVEGLRSGTYKQGSGILRSLDDKFCCLGVACDLAVKAGVKGIFWVALDTCYTIDDAVYAGNPNIPTPTISNWLGLKNAMGNFESNVELTPSLWKLNDIEKYTFDQIADVIEQEQEGLLA